MTIRVLQLITDTDRRGAQVFALDLEPELRDAGLETRTVALAPGATGGLDVPCLGRTRRGRDTFTALRRELRNADVVIAHGSTTLPMCALVTMGTGVPFVYRQISDLAFWASSRRRRWRVKAALSRAAKVAALWQGSADLLVGRFGVDRSDVVVIPNGVPDAQFEPASADQRTRARARFGLGESAPAVLYIGALAYEKGVDLAIEAIGALDDVHFLVVGEGPERQRLEALAASRAPGRVTFAGSIDDPASAYAAADVVVLPSRGGDSMPAVLIESGLMAIPAVSTPVEAIPDVVVDGVTGVLVPRESAVALRQALADVVAESRAVGALGRAARLHCQERFTMGSVGAQWAALLTGMVQERVR